MMRTGILACVSVGAFIVVGVLAAQSHQNTEEKKPFKQVEPLSSVQGGNSLEALQTEIRELRSDVQKVLQILQGTAAKTADQVTSSYSATSVVKRSAPPADEVEIIPIEFANVHEVQDVMHSLIGPKARVHVLDDSNTLVILAPANDLERAVKVITKLDRPKQQIRITSHFFDVAVEDLAKLGVAGSEGARVVSSGAAQHDAETIVAMVNELKNSRLLANPVIQAYDRTEATFRAVAEIPVQQLTQTAEGGAIGTTEFREAGITLTVEPRISKGDQIVLDIRPEVSVLNGMVDGQPVIDRRSAAATVKVPDAGTVLLSGLRSPSGRLSGDDNEPARPQTELLVMIKAEVMTR